MIEVGVNSSLKAEIVPCRAQRVEYLWFDPWIGEDPLEKEMATHFSILAWEIPWTEELGGLHSPWDCRRVRHSLVTK